MLAFRCSASASTRMSMSVGILFAPSLTSEMTLSVVIGLICNYLIKPVDKKWNMSAEEVAKLQAAREKGAASTGSHGIGFGGLDAQAAMFWAFVGIPLAWGVWKTLESTSKIF